MNYLLDTNICIYFLKGRYGLVEKMDKVGFENLFISEITVAELKFGVEKSSYPNRNRPIIDKLIRKFKLFSIYSPFDIYVSKKTILRKGGNIVPQWIVSLNSNSSIIPPI